MNSTLRKVGLVGMAGLLIAHAALPCLANEGDVAAAVPVANAATDQAALAQGRQLYARHCSHCHGFNMVNAGNSSYDLRKFPADNKARFLDSVTNGKNGRMPPWASLLSNAEMDELWAYVLTKGKP